MQSLFVKGDQVNTDSPHVLHPDYKRSFARLNYHKYWKVADLGNFEILSCFENSMELQYITRHNITLQFVWRCLIIICPVSYEKSASNLTLSNTSCRFLPGTPSPVVTLA
jgi:hypothetical protein